MIRINAAKRTYTCAWWISGPMFAVTPHVKPQCELRDALTEAQIRKALTELSSYRVP